MDSDHAAQLCLALGERNSSGGFTSRAPRPRALLSGKIVHGNGAYSIDCVIRDFTAGGAKVFISRQQSLPPNVYLIAIKYGAAYHAKVAWARYPMRGLQFLAKFELNAELPAELKFLRRLWVDLSARSGLPE